MSTSLSIAQLHQVLLVRLLARGDREGQAGRHESVPGRGLTVRARRTKRGVGAKPGRVAFAAKHSSTATDSAGGEPRDVSWSDGVVRDSHADAGDGEVLGLRLRSATPGPEQDLVHAFLGTARMRLRSGRRLSVFVEPALDTGFPDLVAVVWREEVARSWSARRALLQPLDLRLLHLLTTGGVLRLDLIRTVFRRGYKQVLSRLEDAGLVVVAGASVRARRLSSIFAVERIIAVEAKVSGTRRALEQACANVWFSSESHALLPSVRTGERVRAVAATFGIGLIGVDRESARQVHDAAVRSVPLSYGSWLFNEWTWRMARRQGAL